MKQYDITIITASEYLNPSEVDWYTEQVLTEDRLVQEALERQNMRVYRTNWDNPNFDWSSTSFVLLRTCWDYSSRFLEFSKWLERVQKQSKLINSASQIEWNINKHYLEDLMDRGVLVPPTKIITPKTKTSLKEWQEELEWDEMVLKPVVSAGGRHTYRIKKSEIDDYEPLFRKLIDQEAMLLQPFLQQIVTKGEIAIMVINGKVTHSVLKRAKAGDFRVQDDFGGSVEDYQANAEEVAFAEKVVAACPEKPIYARVDLLWDNDNRIALSEIELIEPEMWFRKNPAAADDLAKAIVAYKNLLIERALK